MVVPRFDFGVLSALVVDDSPFFCDLFSDILNAFGIKTIRVAKSSKEALDVCEEMIPNIIFIDWEMVTDTCEDFLKTIHADDNHHCSRVPVVLLTGYSDVRRIRLARDLGISEYVVKPISAATLHTRLVNLIKNPREFVVSENFRGPDRRRRSLPIEFADRRLDAKTADRRTRQVRISHMNRRRSTSGDEDRRKVFKNLNFEDRRGN